MTSCWGSERFIPPSHRPLTPLCTDFGDVGIHDNRLSLCHVSRLTFTLITTVVTTGPLSAPTSQAQTIDRGDIKASSRTARLRRAATA